MYPTASNCIDVKKNPTRNPLFDVIKGLGITCIVIGHCPPNAVVCNFVYSFHLAVFVFVSGMQINPGKYSYQPWLLVTSRLRRLWPAYFSYLTIFTLTSNFFALHRFLPWNSYRETSEIFSRVFNNFVFRGSEAFGGALWFVPMLLITVALFAIVLYLSFGYFKNYQLLIAGVLSVAIGVAGIVINSQKIDLAMHAQTSFLLLPILYTGYLLSSLNVDKSEIFNIFMTAPCLTILWFFVVKPGRRIDLSADQIGEPCTFYITTFAGVYLICVVAKLMCKFVFTRCLFSWLGKYSFDIMAMHFMMFKVVDRFWEYLWPNLEVPVTTFPCVDGTRWPVYLSCSLLFPPLFRMVLNKGIGSLKKNAATTLIKEKSGHETTIGNNKKGYDS